MVMEDPGQKVSADTWFRSPFNGTVEREVEKGRSVIISGWTG